MSKNKTPKAKTTIVWPEGHFTIDDIQNTYKDIVNITLRFHVAKAEDNGTIILIGKVKPPIGRPRKVFVKAGTSDEVIQAAYAAGVLHNEVSEPKVKKVKVAEVEVQTPPTDPQTSSVPTDQSVPSV